MDFETYMPWIIGIFLIGVVAYFIIPSREMKELQRHVDAARKALRDNNAQVEGYLEKRDTNALRTIAHQHNWFHPEKGVLAPIPSEAYPLEEETFGAMIGYLTEFGIDWERRTGKSSSDLASVFERAAFATEEGMRIIEEISTWEEDDRQAFLTGVRRYDECEGISALSVLFTAQMLGGGLQQNGILGSRSLSPTVAPSAS